MSAGAEPFYTDERTKECLGGTVRVLLTATNHWIVQHKLGSTWYYADSPLWLGLTVEQFSAIRTTYERLLSGRQPAPFVTTPRPTPEPTGAIDLDLESLL